MSLFDVYPRFPIEPVRGEGNYIFDKQGNQYLDFYGGHAVISIGHSHPHFLSRMKDQMDRLIFYSNSVEMEIQNQLAEQLLRQSNCPNHELFLCNSGAEANENALKLASFYNKRKKVLAFKNAFHGRTSGAVAITDNPAIISPFNTCHQVEFCELDDLDSVAFLLNTEEFAAVIIEGIQGLAGIYEPTSEFLNKLSILCKKTDTVLILDEIQSGYGRSGDFFAFQKSEIEPDIISMAKGMGNGFPIGGILISNRFKASYGMLGTTFGGNHLACAAGLAVLEVIEKENLIENAKKTGLYLIEQLRSFSDIKEIRGRGLMIAIELDRPIKNLRTNLLMNERIFTGSSKYPNVLRLLPSLTIGEEEIQLFLEKFNHQIKKEYA